MTMSTKHNKLKNQIENSKIDKPGERKQFSFTAKLLLYIELYLTDHWSIQIRLDEDFDYNVTRGEIAKFKNAKMTSCDVERSLIVCKKKKKKLISNRISFYFWTFQTPHYCFKWHENRPPHFSEHFQLQTHRVFISNYVFALFALRPYRFENKNKN